jgi:hypothetical protein
MFRASNVVAVVGDQDQELTKPAADPRGSESLTGRQFTYSLILGRTSQSTWIFSLVVAVACVVVGLFTKPGWKHVAIAIGPPTLKAPPSHCLTGAVILPHLTTPPSYPHDPLSNPLHSAHILLHESGDGNFFFDGSVGRVAIAFTGPTPISHVQIDISTIPRHIPTLLSPRKIVIWGSTDQQEHLVSSINSGITFPEAIGHTFFEVVRFDFDYSMTNRHIPILKGVSEVEVVIIEVLDNWGGSSTCLHRIRFFCQ